MSWCRCGNLYLWLFQGSDILCNLSQADYEQVIGVLENAILSTDLALYFRWEQAGCFGLVLCLFVCLLGVFQFLFSATLSFVLLLGGWCFRLMVG